MTATPSYCSCSRSCSERNVWTVNQARGTGRERTWRGKDLVCRGEPGWERRWPTSLPTAQPPGSSGKAQAGRPSFPGRLEGRRQVARMKIHKTRQEKAACSAVTHNHVSPVGRSAGQPGEGEGCQSPVKCTDRRQDQAGNVVATAATRAFVSVSQEKAYMP